MRKFIAILMTLILVVSGLPVYKADAAAYDPVTKTEGSKTLDLRFWEDQKPDIGFYINAANRYILETVTDPRNGSTFGEWSVMDLLRASYTGFDYLNHIPDNYYEKYLDTINGYVVSKKGVLDRSKSTEWSRLALSMSSLGVDIRKMGEPGTYLDARFIEWNSKGYWEVNTSQISNAYAIKLNEDNTFSTKEDYGIQVDYINKSGKGAKGYGRLPAGDYIFDEDSLRILDADTGEPLDLEVNVTTSSSLTGTFIGTTVTKASILELTKPYDFIEEMTKSYKFSYRQGINGPIWILLQMDTGGYDLYSAAEMQARGITPAKNDLYNTKGLMIDYILDKEITDPNKNNRVGGWALTGKVADPDITMMAVQGLAPYYLSEEKFKRAYAETKNFETSTINDKTIAAAPYYDVESEEFKQKYIEFKKAVERAVLAMSQDIYENGAFLAWGNVNAESTVQVLVALHALGMDPLAKSIHLPTLNENVTFITEGGVWDGVWTNNMIDAIIAHWAMGSSINGYSEVSGFKHVTAGNDGGGGSGTVVNAMATDQATYGLISQHRFENGQKTLYDMTDMTNGEYKTMKAKELAYTYMADDTVVEQGTFSPYEVLIIPEPPAKDGYKAVWTTQPDGTGAVYYAGEKLSTPDHAITLYAQYVVPYEITYELNDGQWLQENAEQYAPATRTLTLPTAAHIQKDNHVFYGWYATADFQGEAVTALNDSTQLQHMLYAKWVSFDTLIANANAAIEALPEVTTITLADEALVNEAQAVLEAVPTAVRSQVKNAQKITDLQNMLLVLKASDAIALIPTEAQLTTADTVTVQAAREAYNTVPSVVVDKVIGTDVLTRAEDVLKVLTIEDQITALPEKLNLTHLPRIEEVTAAIQKLPGSLQIEIKNIAVYQEKLNEIQHLQQQATDIDYANAVRTLINALPTEIKIEHEAQLNEAVKAYDRLTAAQKGLIPNEAATLSSLADQLNALLHAQKVTQLQAQIAALPATTSIKLEDKEEILTVYEAYLAASSEVKQAVDRQPLNKAVASFIDLQISSLPTQLKEADRPALNAILYFYQEVDASIQSLVTSYKKLEQAYVTLDNASLVAKANEVIAKINLIPATVTLTSASVIEAARTAYDSLTATEKTFVTNIAKLTQAESTLKTLENALKNDVTQLVNAIKQLPTTIMLSHKNTVTTLQNSYNALSSTAKAQVTNYQTLVNAVQAIANLEAQDKQIVQAMQAAITALPDAASITSNHQAIIEDVRAKYNSLTATQKASIDPAKLVAAEKQLQTLLNVDSSIEKPADETDKTNDSSVNPPTPSNPLVTETDEKLIVQAISNGSESIATITPNWIQALTVPSIEVDTNTGIRVIVPKNAIKQYTKPIQLTTKIDQRGTERSINITFGTMDGSQYVARRAITPFTIRIPAAMFMAPQASTTALAFEPGVILGYSADKGYYAVPHIYENGEFIVTASEGHTLVYRTEHITFDDIQGSIFQNEIEYLASRFVIKGYDDAAFRPDEHITRGQFAALISRALDLKPTKATTFRDGFYSEFRDDMQAVYEAGIMRGYSDTKFGTNEPLTREQAAATMARVLEYMDYEAKRNLVHFNDKEQIDPAFVKQIELLNTLNIMSGHADGSFKPKDQLTRGQLAKILQRTLALTKVM